MKHWDLTPKQKITLIREDGHQEEAQFLFRDTVRACFQILDEEQCAELVQFQLMDDGTLKDSPTKEQLMDVAEGHKSLFGSPTCFLAVLEKCARWRIGPCPA